MFRGIIFLLSLFYFLSRFLGNLFFSSLLDLGETELIEIREEITGWMKLLQDHVTVCTSQHHYLIVSL